MSDKLDFERAGKGFITLGINTQEDRIYHCYGLACSIKASDPDSQVCLVVDKDKMDIVKKEYHHAFDYIVELPFGNTAYKDGFHGMNLWQMYHCTPFKDTIYVDADTILHNIDIDLLWKTMQINGGISIPTQALSFKHIPIFRKYRFEFEELYALPQLFNNMIYFKRDHPDAEQWFKMADPIMQNWRSVYNYFFKDKKPLTFNKNILCNLVTHCTDLHKQIGVHLNNHYDLHSDSQGVWTDDIPQNWTEMLNYWISGNGKIQIENHVMTSGIIHYNDEKFFTKELLDTYVK